jgi:hypothetical protein
MIILYFDSITTGGVCLNVRANRQTYVAELKKSVVKIYDYYNEGN